MIATIQKHAERLNNLYTNAGDIPCFPSPNILKGVLTSRHQHNKVSDNEDDQDTTNLNMKRLFTLF